MLNIFSPKGQDYQTPKSVLQTDFCPAIRNSVLLSREKNLQNRISAEQLFNRVKTIKCGNLSREQILSCKQKMRSAEFAQTGRRTAEHMSCSWKKMLTFPLEIVFPPILHPSSSQ